MHSTLDCGLKDRAWPMRGVMWVMGHGSHWRSGTKNELHVNNDVCPHLMWYQKTNAKEAIIFTF
jgi:hypothetical protein